MITISKNIAAICCIVLYTLVPIQFANAQQKVVVVPLIGNDSELKPIRPIDLIDTRVAFTNSSSRLTLGTVTDQRGFVLTSLTVAPEFYPLDRRPISLRFCNTRPSGATACSHSWAVPNDDVTELDWGIGEIFAINGLHYIDVGNRGGLASNNAAQQIIVQASGYFYKKMN